MKKFILYFFVLFSTCFFAQVGINTTTPNAQLDIRSSNQTTPSNTDGMLIPKMDTFPATNPTIDQQGMLVYLTTSVGSNPPGFYYWNNPTSTWIPIGNNNNNNWNVSGNLGTNDATNFIGTLDNTPLNFRVNNSNVGKFNSSLNNYAIGLNTLTQTNPGTQTIAIGSGAGRLQQTGTFGNVYVGHLAGENNATGLRNTFMGLNAGRNNTSASNSTIIGFNAGLNSNGSSNTYMGFASGFSNTSGGLNTFIGVSSGQANTTGMANTYLGAIAGFANTIGQNNTFVGHQSGVNNASGSDNLFLGQLSGQNNTIGSANTAIGKSTRFLSNNLNNATAIGNLAAVGADNALVLGSIMGVNSATSSVNVGIGVTNPSAVFEVESNDKGILIPRVALTSANVTSPITNPNGGALLESTLIYNTTTAGVGENEVTPGFHYWNGSRWIKFDTNETGKSKYYTAIGTTNASASPTKALLPEMQITFTPKSNVVMIQFSASGFSGASQAALFFDLRLNGSLVKGFQTSCEDISNATNLPIWDINFLYPVNVSIGIPQTIDIVWGNPQSTRPANLVATIAGAASPNFFFNAHRVLTVIDPNGGASIETTTPIPVTNSFWSPNGNSGLNSTANFIGTNDNVDLNFRRNGAAAGGIKPFNTHLGVASLFDLTTGTNNAAFGNNALNNTSIGNSNVGLGNSALVTNTSGNFNTGIGSFSNVSSSNLENATAIGARSFVAASNSLVLGSISGINGATSSVNVGIGTTIPQERLHVGGRTLLTNGFSADNAALLYQNDTDYMFLGPQSGSSANGAAIALFGSTNASGSNAGGLDINVPNALVRMNHNNGNFTFGTNSTSGYTGIFELNDNGLEIGHNSASRAILFNPNSTERMRLTPAGNLGVGTNNPLQKLHVSGPAGLTAVRIANTSGTGSTSNVALDFFRNTAANTDWRIYNIGANLTIGNSGDDLTTVNDLYQYQGVRFMPMNDATQNLGQATNRWNTLFASNGTINTSDAREKKNIQNLNYGLNALMQLRPVSFEWKKDDGSGTKLGLIAQELKQVVPEVVRDWDWEEDEQGNRKKAASPILGVYYSDLIPVLIKATQEQQVIIEQQKEEIELLKQHLQEQYQVLLERIKKIEEK